MERILDLLVELDNDISQELLTLLGDFESNNDVFKSKDNWLRTDYLLRQLGIEERQIEAMIGDVHHNVFKTQVEFATKIFKQFSKGHRFVLAQAPMQFGKTGTQYYLANALISNTTYKNVLFLTSMSDVSLYHQNKLSLSQVNYKENPSRIKVLKMSQFKADPQYYIERLNIGYIFYDECDYGSGADSSIDKSFFQHIYDDFEDVSCMMISATPYDALYSLHMKELEGVVVQTQPPKTYFGIRNMLEQNMVEDLDGFEFLTEAGSMTNRFKDYMAYFSECEGKGIAIVRSSNRSEMNSVTAIKSCVDSSFGDSITTLILGVKHSNINKMITEELPQLLSEGKKVLIIVINALTAGKDLGEMKSHVRLVIETRKTQIANTCQGLVGRVCGYHGNRNIKIVTHQKNLEYYADLETSYCNIFDEDFIDMIAMDSLNLCTHLKKLRKGSKEAYNIGKVRAFISMDTLHKINDPDILDVVNGNRQKGTGHIQSQRLSNYTADASTKKFKEMVMDCKDHGFINMSLSHRYRAEKKKGTSDRIKVFVAIIDDGDYHEHGVYIIDVTEETVRKKGLVTNKSSMYSKFLEHYFNR